MNHNQLPELPSDLKSLAANLAALVPSAGNLGRDELMYRSGWAACAAAAACADSTVHAQAPRDRRAEWLWPSCTAGLVLVAATLGIALATRTPEVRVVYIERPERSTVEAQASQRATAVSTDTSHDDSVSSLSRASSAFNATQMRAGQDYLSLRQRVLAFGVDVLQSRAVEIPSQHDASVGDSRYGALIGQLRGG